MLCTATRAASESIRMRFHHVLWCVLVHADASMQAHGNPSLQQRGPAAAAQRLHGHAPAAAQHAGAHPGGPGDPRRGSQPPGPLLW